MNFSNMTKDERMAHISKIHIDHPQFQQLEKKIRRCHHYSKVVREPQCMLIEGDKGVGKTRLAEMYKDQYPVVEREADNKIRKITPVFYTGIPAQATPNTLVSELLDALGDMYPDAGNTTKKTKRLRHLQKECGVGLVFLDEFQHFVDRRTPHAITEVSDWLKRLIDQTGVPIILLGMPNSHLILDANPQLKRRFPMKEKLLPFGWTTKEEQDAFRSLLKLISQQLPFEEKPTLAERTMAFRFFCASRGYISEVMKLLEQAAIEALENGQESLALTHFAIAYNQRNGTCLPDENPFLMHARELKLPKAESEEMITIPAHWLRNGQLFKKSKPSK